MSFFFCFVETGSRVIAMGIPVGRCSIPWFGAISIFLFTYQTLSALQVGSRASEDSAEAFQFAVGYWIVLFVHMKLSLLYFFTY